MHTTPTTSDRNFLLLLLLTSAAGALLFLPRYYVGFANDDASFLLLARLITNSLTTLSFSGLGANFSHFLPGYPFFLAPFVSFMEPHWALLRLTTAATSVLTVYGLWLLLSGWLSEEQRRWATGLYAIHPLFLVSSGLVMADPLLTCLFVYGLLGLRWVLEGKTGAWAYVLLVSMSAWAPATKPIGILLPAALTAALIPARAWKALRLLAGLIWLPLLALAIASVLSSKTPTDYTTQMLHGLASLAQFPILQRVYGLLRSFVLIYGLGGPWPRGTFPDLAGAALAALILYFCVKGLSSLIEKKQPARFVAIAAWLLLLSQGLVMAIWTVYSERYALPMLPLGIIFVVSGVYSALSPRTKAARVILSLAAALFLAHTLQLAVETYSPLRPADTKLYAATLKWIDSNTQPESKFIGNAAVVCLYTGRCGSGIFVPPNLDLFLASLSRAGITHGLITRHTTLSTKGAYANNQARQQDMERAWLRNRPRFFKKVYSNSVEKTEVYEVNIPPGWAKASGLYLQALADIQNSPPAAAEEKLRQALSADPDFTSAMMALAMIKLLQGKDPAVAEKLLRKALAIEPNYPRATNLLSELLQRQGRAKEAARVRLAGEAARSAVPFEVSP